MNDHEDDQTCFEISIINKKNMAMGVDCKVFNGEIEFGNVKVVNENGLNHARMTWVDKIVGARRSYKGPSFKNLSEPLQNSIVEIIYEAGVRPEIGLAVEYLSLSKEQRLYMAWLRDMYAYLSSEDETKYLN